MSERLSTSKRREAIREEVRRGSVKLELEKEIALSATTTAAAAVAAVSATQTKSDDATNQQEEQPDLIEYQDDVDDDDDEPEYNPDKDIANEEDDEDANYDEDDDVDDEDFIEPSFKRDEKSKHKSTTSTTKKSLPATSATNKVSKQPHPDVLPGMPEPQTRTIFKLDDPNSTTCEYCGKNFRNVIDKRNHRRTHSQPKKYECNLCGKRFSQRPNVILHKTRVHKDLQINPETLRTEFSDPTTTTTATAIGSSSVPEELLIPKLAEVRVFHCDIIECTKTFLTYKDLLTHKITDHKNQKIPSVRSLSSTTSTTNSSPPTSSSSSSNRPYKKSTRPKINKCTHEGCDKAFAKASDLVRHIRVHTGERPFICEICNAGFNQRYRLTTHMRVHTREKPFACSYCGKRFARGDAVQSHIFVMHRSKGEAIEKFPGNLEELNES